MGQTLIPYLYVLVLRNSHKYIVEKPNKVFETNQSLAVTLGQGLV